jgi:hypothetical protein
MARNKFIGKRADYGRKEDAATVKVIHRHLQVEVMVLVLIDALEAVVRF